jgi:hypothetical protein
MIKADKNTKKIKKLKGRVEKNHSPSFLRPNTKRSPIMPATE